MADVRRVDRVHFVVCDDNWTIESATTDPEMAAAEARAHHRETGHRPLVVGVDVTYVHDPLKGD
jgi:hypothetical protein